MAMGTVGLGGNMLANTNRRPSDSIWGDCPIAAIREGSIPGFYSDEDFTQGGLITSPTTEAALVGLPYIGFGSSGATITYGDEQGGTLVLTEATDNEAVYAKNKPGVFQISSNKGRLWYETRIKVNAITDNQIGFIAGLMDDTAMTVIVPLSTANPPIFATTSDFVGFWGREEDAGLVGSTYKAGGVAGAGGLVVQTGVHQFVADTYVKLGMKFDPKDPIAAGPAISFWVNGVRQSSYKTVPNNTGTDFPADVRLNWMFGHRLGASTSSLTTCDWVKVYQEVIE
jgi:hypothetical protein